MAGLSATVIGATGLVGTQVVLQLCADPAFDAVHVLGRRRFSHPAVAGHPKLDVRVAELDRIPQSAWPASDVLFCCLGTTIRTAGSQEAFRAVDHGMVVSAARLARSAGTHRMMVISAMGADPGSRFFYNRVKGEMESALAAIGFEAVGIFRPSLLEGERQERRLAERAGLMLFKAIKPLLPKKYRSVTATAVARAMIAASKTLGPGVHVMESNRILAYA